MEYTIIVKIQETLKMELQTPQTEHKTKIVPVLFTRFFQVILDLIFDAMHVILVQHHMIPFLIYL